MSVPAFIAMEPRKLTKLEATDIHILVKATRTVLGLPPERKKENDK